MHTETANRTAAEIRQWLIDNIADRLDIPTDQISIDKPITDLGLSSREAIMLSGELEEWLGLDLPPELLYEYPQIRQLSQKLAMGQKAFSEEEITVTPLSYDLSQYASFIDILLTYVQSKPQETAFVHLLNGEQESGSFTYEKLDRRARAIAAHLQSKDLAGERALILFPSSIDFIAAFFGCLYAGVIAVPAFPPQKTRGVDRIASIVHNAGAKIAMVSTNLMESLQKNRKFQQSNLFDNIEWLHTDTIDDELAERWKKPDLNRDNLAFLQYTSGSTGDPKGVMVSHGNILDNCAVIGQAYKIQAEDVAVCWLPMYHDMGLIGHMLFPSSHGLQSVFMPPTAFLEKPVRWLQAMTKYNGSLSAAPNFGYELCAEKIYNDALANIDLSKWTVAINGSEPVRGETMHNFYNKFKQCGFRMQTFISSYGMAETTLLITCEDKDDEPTILHFDGEALEKNRAELTNVDAVNAVAKASCGIPRFGRMAIVNPETLEEVSENQIGEIWVKGESVAQGYWNNADATKETFQAHIVSTNEGPFLRTGDLGFLRNTELFFTGRLKDLIIIRGRNHYPQDIETTVQDAHPALIKDGAAAFSAEVMGAERLVVLQEVQRTALRDLDADEVIEAIRSTVTDQHDLQTYAVVLISPGRLPRTTSGKMKRRAAKKEFLNDTLAKVAEWQLQLEDIDFEKTDAEWVPVLTGLLAQSPQERMPIILDYLQNLVCRVLKISASEITLDKPIINLGLDSMHAIEIKGRVEADLQQELEVTEILQGATIADIAKMLSKNLVVPKAVDAASVPVATNGNLNVDALNEDEIRELLVDIDKLSAEEVEALLNKLEE